MPAKRAAARPSFSDEVGSGDLRRGLIALRDKLVASIEETEGFHVAPLAKQLAEVLAQLDGIKVPEVSARDDLARRRAERRAPAVPRKAAKKVNGGAGSGRVGGKRGPAARSVAGGVP